MRVDIDQSFPTSFNWKKELLLKLLSFPTISRCNGGIVLEADDKNDLVIFIRWGHIYMTAPG